jgi:hypothetical protein
MVMMNINLIQVTMNHRRPPAMFPLAEIARIGNLRFQEEHVDIEELLEKQAQEFQYSTMYEQGLSCSR